MASTLDLNDALKQLLQENPEWTLSEIFPKINKSFPDATKPQVKNRLQRVRAKLESEAVEIQNLSSNEACSNAGRAQKYSRKNFTSDAFCLETISEKGIGALATRNIAKGELLVSEKPWLEADPNAPGGGDWKVQLAAREVYLGNQFAALRPEDQAKIMALHDAFCTAGKKTLVGIFLTNANSRGSSELVATAGRAVLCCTVARFNHSCCPNAVFTWRDHEGCESIVTVRDIACGEEICVTYGNLQEVSAMRQARLLKKYGFQCKCDICVQDPAALTQSDLNRALMKDLEKQIPLDSEACNYTKALAKVDQLFLLGEQEKLTFSQARNAAYAFQLTTFAGSPAIERMKWCKLAIDSWIVSHGDEYCDVLQFKRYMHKLPTPQQLTMDNMRMMEKGL